MKIAIAGATGRMGGTLIEGVLKDGALTLAAALEMPGHAALGKDAGGVALRADIDGAVAACDALIDFTRPAGALAHLDACVRAGKMMVIGTTGFSAAEQAKIDAASRRIAVMMAPNFAVGVNVLFKLAGDAAKALGNDFDVEIVEAHHRHKVDAPSGTALKLGEIVAGALGRKLNAVAVHGREGDTGARERKVIGFHAIRGGDIVGEHTVIFAGEGERVELTIRSQSRMTYALGALRAAKWLRGKPPGLYDMFDVLGLK
ncbi:MAG: 4-hydroxy-tetrahydrodipicolinate reductase [Betaproteobacteria bacterium]|nr:4-hydroxy-tetrahydrodipicolinate reductase [Betaproteobacteria bacterium]